MRNLRNCSLSRLAVAEGLNPSAIAWDVSDDSVIYAARHLNSDTKLSLWRSSGDHSATDSKARELACWDVPPTSPDSPSNEIICLQYFSDNATACLVFAGGDLVVVREEPGAGEEAVEIVGSVDAGIAAAAWAPDQDLLSIVTCADTLILMTRDFEPVTDVMLSVDDLNASKHVSVGWGKKETQFQGKRAKALRDPTIPETIDEGLPSFHDDGRTSISWRGDGAFLAINRHIAGHRRAIRVFTREGTLESVSEPADGLESAISWRPSGNLITGVQRWKDRLDVIFFERNGLRHGEFSLRLTKEEMDTWASNVALLWNVDSSVLAVSFRDRVQLWTMGNYHYYFKQEIKLLHEASILSQPVLWHLEKPLRLALSATETILDAEYVFHVDKGSTAVPHDNGIVAVIDGKLLKLTALKYAMIPPPMSSAEIVTVANILDCSVGQNGHRIGVLMEDAVEIYEWDFRSKLATIPKLVAKTNLGPEYQTTVSHSFRHITMVGNDSFTLLSPHDDGPDELSYQVIDSTIKLISEGSEEGELRTSSAQIIHTDLHHGSIWRQTPERLIYSEEVVVPLKEAASAVAIVTARKKPGLVDGESTILTNGAIHDHLTDIHIFYVSRRGDLFAKEVLLARGCTSFTVTDANLLFTTSQNLLKFVHLSAVEVYDVPGDTPEIDERCRSIERGAKIVTVMPSIYAVVLQMPRGNLETIYPRALVLAGIRQHLEDRDFRSAFIACENHQVDMNIMYDYDPDLFMANISIFVKQLGKPKRIDLFLSKLSEVDVSQTLYKNTLAGGRASRSEIKEKPGTINPLAGSGSSKINTVCDALLSVLEPNITKHLQNVLTAHVCKWPPDLVSALGLITSLRSENAEKADGAVTHLCFLTDVNRLYETALSLYDLPLTLLIAQQTQRDPREYIPFLQSLHELPSLRRNFRIDDHLGNYEKASSSLHALSAHDEVSSYTEKHALYIHASRLYRYDNEHLHHITRLHATYLTSQSHHLASAIASESISDYALASKSYAKCSPPRWREALHCALMSDPQISSSEVESLAKELATTLSEDQRDYRAASQIYIEHLHDIPLGARTLCKGSYFADALRHLSLHKLNSRIPEVIDTGLAEKTGEITELIADCRSQLSSQVPRIKDLRLKKDEDPLAFFGGDANGLAGEGDIPDNISLAPTNASTLGGQSLFTRYGKNGHAFTGTVASSTMSRKTSKTRRKEERKRAMGKKGSVYEEEYLVGSLKRLIERVNGVHGEVGRLVEGLMRRGMRERVEMVEEVMGGLVMECQGAVKEIWGSEEVGKDKDEGDDESRAGVSGFENMHAGFPAMRRPKGGDGVLWDSQVTMQDRNSIPGRTGGPEVKVWKSVFG